MDRVKPGTIGFDNSSGNHARSVEDVLADHYIGTRFVGAEMPRDKAHLERVIGIIQDLAFKHMEGANYDIERMRRYKFDDKAYFDPAKHAICSIQTGRKLLNLACLTYNVTSGKSNDRRPPALVWRQKLAGRALDKLDDEQGFAAAIGTVEFDIQLTNSGIEKFYRRYTPGAYEMKRIIKEFDDGVKRSAGDIGFDRRRNTDDRKRPSHKVKCKYDPDNIGQIKVWNPYSTTPGGKCLAVPTL
jgi:hypothetical protein